MSDLIKKFQTQKAKADPGADQRKLECNYKDIYYGDKTCVPCGK